MAVGVNLTDIIKYENGEMDDEQVVNFFQDLYDSGCWNFLQGSYHRTMNDLVQQGLVRVFVSKSE
jgi:hypothetical protein